MIYVISLHDSKSLKSEKLHLLALLFYLNSFSIMELFEFASIYDIIIRYFNNQTIDTDSCLN